MDERNHNNAQVEPQREEEEQENTLLYQFKQQMLKSWQPVPTLTKTILTFFILSIIFLGLGIPMLILSGQVSEYRVRYDDKCNISTNINCSLDFEIPNRMQGPVYVYYELHNYFQNHRLYAKSFSSDQLKGKQIDQAKAKEVCDPIITNKDLYVTVAIDGSTPLKPNDIANPCGMIAYSIFNDTFSLGTDVQIKNTGIAWKSDVDRFKNSDKSKMWLDVEDQRFMNWVRIAAQPNFKKLWGRIEDGLPAKIYTLQIQNLYDISNFKGEKYFVVSQANFFGAENNFLSITYIVVGALCLAAAIGFLVKKIIKEKAQ